MTVNALYSPNSNCQHTPSRAQTAALDQFCDKYKAMGKPPADLTPAGALRELCHQSLPYLCEEGGPIPFDADLVSLPDVGGRPADPQALLSSAHSDLIRGPNAPMLRSKGDAEQVLQSSGLDKPYIDPSFRSSRIYAKL